MNARVPVAIVGAGYAGMAAAVTLAARGIRVSVFEAGAVPGGRARRVDSRGIALDNGQHVLLGAYRSLLGLMQQVGVPDAALLRVPLELRYADGFSLRSWNLPAPLGILAGLLCASGLDWSERWRAARFMRALRSLDFRLAQDCTVAALLARYDQGGAAARYLWEPLCVSALNTLPRHASANIFLAVLRDGLAGSRADSDLLFPRRDLSQLFPEPAARYLARRGGEIKYGTRITDIAQLQRTHANVILAVGPHQLPALLPALEIDYAFQPIYTCYLQYPAAVRLPAPMLGLGGRPAQWVFDRGLLMGEHGRMACVISAQGEHQELTHEALASACHGELAGFLAQLPQPAWSRVIAEKRATIRMDASLKRLNPETGYPGVFLAGDYLDPEYPPTLEAAVRSGVRVAALVLKSGDLS